MTEEQNMEDAEPTQDAQPGEDAELRHLRNRAEWLMMQLQAGGATFPVMAVRMECLIDQVLPPGTPERRAFDVEFYTRQVDMIERGIEAAKRELMRKGTLGGGAAAQSMNGG